MGCTYIGDSRVKQIYIGNTRITKGYLGDELIFSASNPVTYYIDAANNLSETKEVDYGESVLSYTPPIPSRLDSTWIFLGWREDETATSTILTQKTMQEQPITLYAVFVRDVLCTFKSYQSTQTQKAKRYFNASGDYTLATVSAPTGASFTNWTWRGWSEAEKTSGDTDKAYDNGQSITGIVKDSTFYGLYQTDVTLTYNGNGAASDNTIEETKQRYFNAFGNYVNPQFTLKSNGYTKTSYNFSKWAIGSVSGTQYAVGDTVILTANTTFYAVWTLKSYTTLFSSNDYHIGSNTGADKSGAYTSSSSFNASNATKLQLVVSGYHNDTPQMKVYLLSSITETASDSNLVFTQNVPGYTANGNAVSTYTFDIPSSFIGNKYVHIVASCYLYIYSIKYV